MAEEYVCKLDEASMKVAVEELNEDPVQRLSQVQTFRDWINQQKHMKAPTDTSFLLKFLRPAKYSQLVARKLLEGYLKIKAKYPEWVNDIDMSDPKIIEFLRTGYTFFVPQRDSKGRQICFINQGSFTPDKKKFDPNTMIKALVGLSLFSNTDENNIVNGYIIFDDFSHFSIKHLNFWGMETMQRMSRLWEGNIPGRFKEFHFFNPGPVFETLMAACKPLFSKKLQERFHVHGKNMEDMYKVIPAELFPEEYLPDDYKGKHQGKIQDIVEKIINDLKSPEVRDRILYETSSEWTFDKHVKPTELGTSFRKLSVE